MILKDTLYDSIFWFCVIVGILLTMYIGCKLLHKEINKNIKNITSKLGVSAILSAICAFLLFWGLNLLFAMIVSYGAIEINEIVLENGTYSIISKYYFESSKIPTGNDFNVLKESKGTHYYNGTDKEIVYFSRKYYSEFALKMMREADKLRETDKPLDLIHMNNSCIRYDTVTGVIIKPLSFFNMTKKVDCAFMPSPTSITVTRYRKYKYTAFESDSITIMDVKDSVVNHNGVIIKSTQ